MFFAVPSVWAQTKTAKTLETSVLPEGALVELQEGGKTLMIVYL